MNARNVQAIIAAGLQRPDLILRWQKDPTLLSSRGIEPGEIDLSALWHFAGLTIKVRHNGLRLDLPLTFRLMRVSGLEIEIFASYATFRASRNYRYASTSEARAADLTAFLEQWLDLRKRSHSLLWDMIRHEQALARLRRSVLRPPEDFNHISLDPSSDLTPRSQPLVRGEISLHKMKCDPSIVESALFNRPPCLDRIPVVTNHYCYWRASDSSDVNIVTVDEFGYYALSLIDGVRCVRDLSLALGGTRRPTQNFLRALSQLASTGILLFRTCQNMAIQ